MQKYTVAQRRVTLEEALHLWPVIFTRYQDDDGSGVTVNTDSALGALVEIGKVLKQRSAVLKGILQTPDQRLFKALLTEVEEIGKYESDKEDLNGNEELPLREPRGWVVGARRRWSPRVARAMQVREEF